MDGAVEKVVDVMLCLVQAVAGTGSHDEGAVVNVLRVLSECQHISSLLKGGAISIERHGNICLLDG